jgi:anti-sigma B factor antagonist
MTDPAEGELAWQIMQLPIAQVGPAIVVSVAGVVDMLTAPRLADALNTALVDAPADAPVVVGLSRVSVLDSHGLTALAEAASAASAAGGQGSLRVVVGNARTAIRPLQITGLNTLLLLYSTLDDALTSTP